MFRLFGGLSKSVSPDEDRDGILATYTMNRAKLVRAKYTGIFYRNKGIIIEIRVDTDMLMVEDVVPNKNKKEDSLQEHH